MNKTKTNIHPWERTIRIILGGVLLSMGFFAPEDLWYLVGILPFVTGLAGLCPVYSVLKFSSKKS